MTQRRQPWWPRPRPARSQLWQVGILDGDEAAVVWLGPFTKATAQQLYDQLGAGLGTFGSEGIHVVMQPCSRREVG